jgi:hypothetical protein
MAPNVMFVGTYGDPLLVRQRMFSMAEHPLKSLTDISIVTICLEDGFLDESISQLTRRLTWCKIADGNPRMHQRLKIDMFCGLF